MNEQAEEYLNLLHALGRVSARVLEHPSEENDAEFERALGRVMAFEKAHARQQVAAGQTLLESLLHRSPIESEDLIDPVHAAGQIASWRDRLQTITQALFTPLRSAFKTGDSRWRMPVVAGIVGLAALVVILLVSVLVQSIGTPSQTPAAQIALAQDVTPAIVVLDVQGSIYYLRQGWTQEQAVVPGTQLDVEDRVMAENATMRVLCPNGSIVAFPETQMPANDVVPCPGVEAAIVGQTEAQPTIVLMGGQQNPAAPYLLSPRATAVRTPSIVLAWNAVPGTDQYTLTVRAGIEVVWESGALSPDETAAADFASISLPVALVPDVAYTVEICVLRENLQRTCTTDPGVSSDVNLAFYYHPLAALAQVERQIMELLGEDTPDSLYARALILSQPFFTPPVGEPIGFYQEALELLQRTVVDFPESALARSAELYNLQGELFRRVNLPRSANLAYRQARALALPQTHVAAVAALGEASTTPDSDQAIHLYDEAVAAYASFLDEAAFEARFSALCTEIGDICLALADCQDRLEQCAQWAE